MSAKQSDGMPPTLPPRHRLWLARLPRRFGVAVAMAAILLTAAALLLTGAVPAAAQGNAACPTPAGGDYDWDDDRLIEVCSLAQLDAIRWDVDGNGAVGNNDYDAAFPGAASGMGCPSNGCNGYELTSDLDFDTNGNGEADAGDAYWNGGKGWAPIHYGTGQRVVFEGNGNTISSLFINRSSAKAGLFGQARNVNIRSVGLESVDVTSQGTDVGGLAGMLWGGEVRDSYVTGSVTGQVKVGGLVGWNMGSVISSHSAGEVSGGRSVGGLVGNNNASIRQSYSTANVSTIGTKRSPQYREDPERRTFRTMVTADGLVSQFFGGLVGYHNGKILGSYATGDVAAGNAYKVGGLAGRTTDSSEIVASYATGDVSNRSVLAGGLVGWNWGKIKASYSSGSVSSVKDVGGLAGVASGVLKGFDKKSVVTAGYWDTEASGQSVSAGGTGKTTSELKAPTSYAGIYADWNVDLDGDGNGDDPWDFGTASQYPVLKDAGPSVAKQREQMQNSEPRAHLKTPGPADSLALSTTPDSLTVVWTPPLAGGMVTGYVAQLTPADGGDGEVKRVSAYELETTFRGLDGGAGYSVSLRGENQAGQGEAVTGQVTLPDALPEGANYWPNPGCKASAAGDYDTDDDGLIEVCNLTQLHAITWDMSGDGNDGFENRDYAFPNSVAGDMGCPHSGCIGYELTADLDFDTNGDGLVNKDDTLFNVPDPKWYPGRWGFPSIGYLSGHHALYEGGIFEGNGHTISNLYIRSEYGYGGVDGLFTWVHHNTVIRNVGLINVNIASGYHVGGLAGRNDGTIINCYVTGKVSGKNAVGGLVGLNEGTIINSWADVDVTGSRPPQPGGSGVGGKEIPRGEDERPQQRYWGYQPGYDVGGLVGYNTGNVRGSYAVGDVSGKASNAGGLVGYNHAGFPDNSYAIPEGVITASYAAGNVSSSGRWVGGLVGSNWGSLNASYALGNATGEDSGGLTGHNGGTITASYWNTDRSRAGDAFGAGKTTSELQTPTDYAGIYAGWNVDLGSAGNADDPWDFGTDEKYPVLKNAGPSVAKQREQIPPAPEFPAIPKPDSDADGLIEVSTLAQLNAIRWDLDGDGSALEAGYAQAFTIPEDGMGCPDTGCMGYELAASLNFDTNGNGRADSGDAYWNGGAGWTPIGSGAGDYAAVFEGNNHTIRNLHMSSSGDDVGLFDGIASGGTVRNVTLEAVMASGVDSVGGLAGENVGTISGARVSGSVWGRSAVGGLAGSSSGVIADSQSRASVMGTKAKTDGGQDVGGLAGYNSGSVRMSYATGKVSGKADHTGGLAGRSSAGSSVIASYATGSVSSTGRYVGGLVGHASGSITASYASGSATGGADAGGLAGHDGGTVTNSYWDTDRSQAAGTAGIGKTTAELQKPTGYEGIYANWNVDVNGDGSKDDPWQFGNPLEYPTLKGAGATPMQNSSDGNQRAEVVGLYSVSAPAGVDEGETATLTISLNDAAPANGVEFTVKQAYHGDNAAGRYDVGKFASPVTVPEGSSALEVAIPTVDNGADRPDKVLTLLVSAVTSGWMKEGEGSDTAQITIRDDDTVGVTVSPATLTVAEGGTAAYTVVLDAETDGNVFITPSSGDVGAVTFTPASVRFTPSSWSWPQTFTVSGVADADAGDESVIISHRVTLGRSSDYAGVTAPPLTVTVQDITPRNFSVTAAARAAEGSDATLTVSLSAAAGPVEFGVTTGYQSGAGKAEAADVGRVPQTVTVEAGQTTASLAVPLATDALTEGDETFTVTLTPPSGWAEASLGGGTATVTITDVAPERQQQEPATAEKPGPVANLQVTLSVEGIAVSWEAPPRGGAPNKYIVRLTPADGGKARVKEPRASKTGVTFGNLEAGATYEVKVRAQNGAGKGEAVRASITVPELPGAAVNLQLLATADSITATWEAPQSGGTPGGYLLNVKQTGKNRDEQRSVGADATTATFDGLEAGATYRVWVRAINAGGKGERVRATVTLPEAPQQAAPDPQPQQTAKTYAITATASATEGSDAALTITLSEAAPAGGVAFTVAAGYSGRTAEADDVGSITSPVKVLEGNTTLEIAVPTASDDVDEDDETFTVTVSATTSGWEKEGAGKDIATVTIADDDTAGVTVTSTTLNVSEDGSGTYTVVLDSQPTADVVVTPASGDGDAAGVSPAFYTFTPSAWNTAQTFTVSGVSDDDRDDESVSVSHGVASSDGKYNGVAAASVSVAVSDTTAEPQPEANQAPTVSAALADAAFINASGTETVSLSGVFSDGDADPLTVTAASSDEAVATVSVAADQSALTVNAVTRGTAVITVTAADGNGGTVSDEFTVTVKAAPVVAQNLPDLFGLEAEASQEVSLAGVFHDADGDALTISVASLDEGRVTASAQSDGSALTLTGVAPGWATVRVTARDADGNRVSDAFNVQVIEAPAEPEADDPPSGVVNLSCTATTEQVTFRWEAPQWSGGELHAYDYDLTLPDGKKGQTRLVGSTSVSRSGDYQAGKEASIGVQAVYKLDDGSKESSAAATLSCSVVE